MVGILRKGPLFAGLLAVALRLALLPVLPVPVPTVHDEFSYLLGTETFASGHLTNPTHPLWIHFETMHENFEPTYQSKYPPAQALLLAFGLKFLGHPWFGVVLGMGLMFAALCWALEGWCGREPALAATVLAVLTWGVTSYWMNSYWGGAIAGAGGALVIGAIPRLSREVSLRYVLLASFGIVLLANTRPYEGGLTLIASAFVLIWWRRRNKRPVRELFTARVIIAALAVLVPSTGAMAYYNYRLTGSATLLPYLVNERRYAASPRFYLSGPIPEPVYNHEVMRRFWTEWDRPLYDAARINPLTAVVFAAAEIGRNWFFGFWMVALTGLSFGAKPRGFAALAIVGLTLIGTTLEKTLLPHYLAPATAAYLVLVAGLFEPGGRRRRVVMIVAFAAAAIVFGYAVHRNATAAELSIQRRPAVMQKLQAEGGRHLVLVRYTRDHSVHEEWVYNHADIDGSDIVWARDMGQEKNRELIEYYPGRKVWLLQPDTTPIAPVPYPPGP